MAEAPIERSGEAFRLDVQGLRAVAVGLVLLYHFDLLRTTGGYVGVDVFFVISGFVIGGLVFREVDRTNKVSMREFYARRARRILPASTLTIVATVIATIVMFGQIGAVPVCHDALAAALFVANFHFANQGTYYFASSLAPSPLLHFWSLAVEEQFYFVFPSLVAILALVTKRGRKATVIAVAIGVVASFIWSVISTNTQPIAAYYSPFTRAWELGIGVLIAGIAAKVRHPFASWAMAWIGAITIAVSAWTLADTPNYPGWIAAIPVIGAALVIIGGASGPARGITRALSSKPMVVMGDYSYSLYLWHFPVIALAARKLGGTVPLGTRLILLLLAVVLAIASYQLVEKPIRNANSLKIRPLRSLAIGALCVTIGVAVAVVPVRTLRSGASVAVAGHPALDQLTTMLVAAEHVHRLPAATDPALTLDLDLANFGIPNMIKTCNPPTYVTSVRLCVYGDTTAKNSVLLYGNSQAQMWAPALDLLGKEHHFKLIAIAKPACGTFVDPGYLGPIFTVSPICQQFVNWSISRINQLKPNVVVVATTTGKILRPGADPNQLEPNGRLPATSYMDPPTPRVASAFVKFVAAIKPSGAHVVLMGDVPTANPVRLGGYTANGCLLANPQNIQRCTLPMPTFTNSEWHRSMLAAATLAKVPLIDVRQLACARYICPPVVNRVLVHFDELHMTRQFILYTSGALYEMMGRYLPAASHSTASR